MRNPKRIVPFLKNMDLEKILYSRWKINKEDYPNLIQDIVNNLEEIESYWLKYYDLRFGQLLINLGYVPDSLLIWNDEISTNLINIDKNEMDS